MIKLIDFIKQYIEKKKWDKYKSEFLRKRSIVESRKYYRQMIKESHR